MIYTSSGKFSTKKGVYIHELKCYSIRSARYKDMLCRDQTSSTKNCKFTLQFLEKYDKKFVLKKPKKELMTHNHLLLYKEKPKVTLDVT